MAPRAEVFEPDDDELVAELEEGEELVGLAHSRFEVVASGWGGGGGGGWGGLEVKVWVIQGLRV